MTIFRCEVALMKRFSPNLKTARQLRFAFFAAGLVMLISVYRGSLAAALLAGVLGGVLAVLIMAARCRECGVSSYWHEGSVANSLGGVDLIRAPTANCKKCGTMK